MSYYLSYFVSYVIIMFFVLKSIDKYQTISQKLLQVLITEHDRSKDHLDAMLMMAHRAKEAVHLDFGVRAASSTGWLPHRGKTQMACNYCLPTRTMF